MTMASLHTMMAKISSGRWLIRLTEKLTLRTYPKATTHSCMELSQRTKNKERQKRNTGPDHLCNGSQQFLGMW